MTERQRALLAQVAAGRRTWYLDRAHPDESGAALQAIERDLAQLQAQGLVRGGPPTPSRQWPGLFDVVGPVWLTEAGERAVAAAGPS